MGGFIDRTGEIKYNFQNEEMIIEEYKTNKNLIVKFISNGEKVKSTYKEFKLGKIKNHFIPDAYNVGFIGVGQYKSIENNKKTEIYLCWHGMLERCYNKKLHVNRPTYQDCSVTSEWHNFQNFAKWYEENYYKIEGQRMCLDKDILFKGNKIYSPETCIFVPNDINVLFTKSDAKRGKYPIGVCYMKNTTDNTYKADCKMGHKKRKYLGCYNTPEKAFNVYKNFKENYIKEVADFYKDIIPKQLYEAMYRYKVEITD